MQSADEQFFTEEEFEVVVHWYGESVKILKGLTVAALIVLGLSLNLIDVTTGDILAQNKTTLVWSWFWLALAAVCGACGVATSYWWYEIMNRLYQPALATKLKFEQGNMNRAKSMSVWALRCKFLSSGFLLIGLVLLFSFAAAILDAPVVDAESKEEVATRSSDAP